MNKEARRQPYGLQNYYMLVKVWGDRNYSKLETHPLDNFGDWKPFDQFNNK